MIDGTKVVTWTPYGRAETVSILFKYMKRDHEAGLLDEYHLFMNTDDDQDVDRAYAERLAATHSWVVLKSRPEGEEVLRPKQLNTGKYYRYAIEPNTVYVRFDDDIVYVHERALERLVKAKLQSPSLVSFPIIWHNAICSYYLQTMGKIPREFGVVQSPHCMDPVGWADQKFAEKIHYLLLDHIEAGTVDSLFLHHDIQLPVGLQFSVSCFAAHSDIYREMTPPGYLDFHEEEHWHTVHRPTHTNRANSITGNALVAHLSFFPHSWYIRNKTTILERYREIANQL